MLMDNFSFLNKITLKQVIISSIILLLAGCGGSSSDDTNFITGETDTNVALSSKGSTTTATYNEVSASNVNDGDTSTSGSWTGNISGDSVTVDFRKIRFLEKITIYTSDSLFNSNSPNKRIELSTDITNNSNWKITAQENGADINCTRLLRTSNTITCSYSNRVQARYIRFTSLTDSLLNVYEIQAIGY